MKRLVLVLAVAALGACDSIPRDQDGTLERIRREGEARIGLIETPRPSVHQPRLLALAASASRDAGGEPRIVRDSGERLLLALEEGELDLVVGEFDSSSPWSTRVHMIPPLATWRHGDHRTEATAAVRHGENGWIMLLERHGRALSTPQ